MTQVINKKGQLIDGTYRDLIVSAHDKGHTFVTIEGDSIGIESVKTDKDGNKTIKINV